jgi:hypothetical protein
VEVTYSKYLCQSINYSRKSFTASFKKNNLKIELEGIMEKGKIEINED